MQKYMREDVDPPVKTILSQNGAKVMLSSDIFKEIFQSIFPRDEYINSVTKLSRSRGSKERHAVSTNREVMTGNTFSFLSFTSRNSSASGNIAV